MKTDLSHPRFQRKKKEPFLLSSKFIAVFFVVSLLLPLLALAVFSHPGRTDSYGGHYNRSTGEYHYHHGYPAHQHTDGVCPYDYDNKTASEEATADDSDDDYDSFSGSGKYTTETQYALMTAKDKKPTDSESFFLLSDPEFLIFASLVVVSIAALAMAIVLRQKSKKIKDLNGSIAHYNYEINRIKSENSKLKEDLRLKTIEYEDALSNNKFHYPHE